MLQEEAVQEVALDNLIGKAFTAVDIFRGRSRLHDATSVLTSPNIRIIEGVDVDSHSLSMLGQLGGSRYPAIAETGGVIITHGPFVAGIIIINQTDALDGIFLPIEFFENLNQVVGNRLVADHFTHMLAFLCIIVRQAQITQIGTTDGTALRPGTALHPLEDGIGNGLGREFLSRDDKSEE